MFPRELPPAASPDAVQPTRTPYNDKGDPVASPDVSLPRGQAEIQGDVPLPKSNPLGHSLEQDRGKKARFLHALQGAMVGLERSQRNGASPLGAIIGAAGGGLIGAVKPERADAMWYEDYVHPREVHDQLEQQAIQKGGLQNQDIQEQIKMRQAQTANIPTMADWKQYKDQEVLNQAAEKQSSHDEALKRSDELKKLIEANREENRQALRAQGWEKTDQGWQRVEQGQRAEERRATSSNVRNEHTQASTRGIDQKTLDRETAKFEQLKNEGMKKKDLSGAINQMEYLKSQYPDDIEGDVDTYGNPYIKRKPKKRTQAGSISQAASIIGPDFVP
jgi:hypothetical protein